MDLDLSNTIKRRYLFHVGVIKGLFLASWVHIGTVVSEYDRRLYSTSR